ncbi:FURIN [Mytilus coruscus]|uniref:FURIN n=1 Tax=Mytilus coruscus TaxID=42192 RepID=A0A6J8CF61_MYTCO|nr:FURIN [Mytilus coruscus]
MVIQCIVFILVTFSHTYSEEITNTIVVRLSTNPEAYNNLRRHSDFVVKKKIIFVEQQIRRDRVKRSNDPEWNSSWHLNDEIVPSMRISEAWSAGYNGDGVVIAVVDDGVETSHPDIDDNVDTDKDYDYYDDDDDPSPANQFDSHGTQISGLIAAEKDNGQCSLGVAYGSTILGVRVIGGPGVTDVEEAQSLRHYVHGVDIYSISWGPPDGYGFSTLGTLATERPSERGRNGKGSIYVWAAGNGELDDNCNGDGYVNSIYTIGITGAQSGENAYYSEVCSAALAATYGGSSEDRYLTTTSINSSCTSEYIEGTSYSCPIAAGIIALALQANNNLTWRDVQYIIVLSSDRYDLNDTYSSWQTNGAYKEVSQVLGFGLMNAADMVYYARNWTNLPEQLCCVTKTNFPKIMTTAYEISVDRTLVTSTHCSLSYIEHVTATVSFSYDRYRGLTEIFLMSPSGTESHLLTNRGKDAVKYQEAGNLTWTFMSVHYWGENPIGNWTLKFRSHKGFTRENQSNCLGDSNVTDCQKDEIKHNNSTEYDNSTDFEVESNSSNCTYNFSSKVCDTEINQSNYSNDNNDTTLDGVNTINSTNYTNNSTDKDPEFMHNNYTGIHNITEYNQGGFNSSNCTGSSDDIDCTFLQTNKTNCTGSSDDIDCTSLQTNKTNCTGSSDDINCSLQTNKTNCTSMSNETDCDMKLDKTNCSQNLSKFESTNGTNDSTSEGK